MINFGPAIVFMDSRLKIFVVAATTLNYSEAAKLLGLTQPAVTQNIRFLEREYGIQLFARQGKGLALTYSGEIFLQRAKEILRKYKELRYETRVLSSVSEGVFRIGLPPALYYGVFPDFSADYCRLSPKAVFIPRIIESKDIEVALINKEIHAGFTHKGTLQPGDVAIFEDRLITVSCRTLNKTEAFGIEDIKFITYGKDRSSADEISALLGSGGIRNDSLNIISKMEDPAAAIKFLVQYGQRGAGNIIPAFGFFWLSQVRNLIKDGLLKEIAVSPFIGKPMPKRFYFLKEDYGAGIPGFRTYAANWFGKNL